jgi:hypothetical protein
MMRSTSAYQLRTARQEAADGTTAPWHRAANNAQQEALSLHSLAFSATQERGATPSSEAVKRDMPVRNVKAHTSVAL